MMIKNTCAGREGYDAYMMEAENMDQFRMDSQMKNRANKGGVEERGFLSPGSGMPAGGPGSTYLINNIIINIYLLMYHYLVFYFIFL